VKLRIGTRASRLALWQAERVAAVLATMRADVDTEIVRIESHGDRDRSTSLADLGTVGIFTREIEAALHDGRADVAVHSLKDMPTESPEGLRVVALLPRDDARDVLIAPSLHGFAGPAGNELQALAAGARVGTSSLRRRAELLRARADLRIVDLRGNVPTRIGRVESGDLDAIVLSLAGLTRLDLHPAGAVPLSMQQMLPAPAQGTIAIQIRTDDVATGDCLAALDDATTRRTTDTERLVLHHLEGGCRIPLGVYAHLRDNVLVLQARLTQPDGKAVVDSLQSGAAADWRLLASQVADDIRAQGGDAILQAARGL
jgi:hydroxymethylbilane synthase